MDGSVKTLAYYRMERAKEMLEASEQNLKIDQYRTSLNRSYYAIFHAMRSINILEGYDSSKHSGVIAYFTQTFLKTERIDRSLARIIKEASYLREKSDYDDFYIASKEETQNQLKNAKCFIKELQDYMQTLETEESKDIAEEITEELEAVNDTAEEIEQDTE